jgi:hypothetical protein
MPEETDIRDGSIWESDDGDQVEVLECSGGAVSFTYHVRVSRPGFLSLARSAFLAEFWPIASPCDVVG